MADTEYKVKVQAQTKQIREAFKETKAMQRQFQKESKALQRKEKTLEKDQTKHLKEVTKLRDGQHSSLKKQHRERAHLEKQQQTQETRHLKEKQKTEDIGNRKRNKQLKEDARQNGGAGGAQGGGKRGIGSTIKAGVGMAAGGIMGFLIGAAMKDYSRYKSALEGMTSSVGTGQGKNTLGKVARGTPYGFRTQDMVGFREQMARATGTQAGGQTFAQAQRASGMGAEEVGDLFKTMRQGGMDFSGGHIDPKKGMMRTQDLQGEKSFSDLIGKAVASNLDRSRMGEFMRGVSGLVRQQMSVSAGSVDTSAYSTILSVLGGKLGKGFQGERGAAITQKMDQGIQSPGGGPEGEAFVRRALGYGTERGFLETEKMREKGMSENPEVFMQIMQKALTDFGTVGFAAYELKKIMGTSIAQNEKMLRLSMSGKSMTDMQSELRTMDKENMSLAERADTAMIEMNDHIKGVLSHENTSTRRGVRGAKLAETLNGLQTDIADILTQYLRPIADGIETLIGWTKTLVQGIATFSNSLGKLPMIGTGKMFDIDKDGNVSWAQSPQVDGVSKQEDFQKKFSNQALGAFGKTPQTASKREQEAAMQIAKEAMYGGPSTGKSRVEYDADTGSNKFAGIEGQMKATELLYEIVKEMRQNNITLTELKHPDITESGKIELTVYGANAHAKPGSRAVKGTRQ